MRDWKPGVGSSEAGFEGVPQPGGDLRQRALQRRMLQRKAKRDGAAPEAGGAVERAEGTSGQPLPKGLQSKFERHLGVDLGGVTVHTGADSGAACDAVEARAYTTGNHIHMGAGQYDPSTKEGEELLGHEVVHTVQQSGGLQRKAAPGISREDDAAETEADDLAAQMTLGGAARRPTASTTATVNRKAKHKHEHKHKHDDPQEDAAQEVSKEVDEENRAGAAESFVEGLAYYTDASFLFPGQKHPKIEDLKALDPQLDSILNRVWAVVTEVQEPIDDPGMIAVNWSLLRGDVMAAIDQAKADGVDEKHVAEAMKGVAQLDRAVGRERAGEMVQAEMGANEVEHPESTMFDGEMKVLDMAAQKVDALIDGSMSVGEKVAEEGGGKAKAAFAAFHMLYSIFTEPGELSEKVEKMQEQGGLEKGATVVDMLSFFGEAIKDTLVIASHMYESAADVEGPAKAALADLAERAKTLDAVADVVGFAVSAFQIASGTLNLIQAIEAHDTDGIIDASRDIAMGGVGVVDVFAGLSLSEVAVATAVIVGVSYELKGAHQMMEQLEAAYDNAALKKIAAVVGVAGELADAAQLMNAAQAAEQDQTQASDTTVNDAVNHQLEKKDVQYQKAVIASLQNLYSGLKELFAEDPELEQAFGKEGMDAFTGDELSYPKLQWRCQAVLAGADRMSRFALKKYGSRQQKAVDAATEPADPCAGDSSDYSDAQYQMCVADNQG